MFLVALLTALAQDCDTAVTERMQIEGTSLVGRAQEGDVVVLDARPSACWAVARGDWVVWQPEGRERPVVKVVRAIAGDQLDIVAMPDGHRIRVNGTELRTTSGQPYVLSDLRRRVLEPYIGTLPAQSVMVLGEVPHGSVDSTRLGLVHHTDLIARVVAIEPRLVPSPTTQEHP